MNPSLYRSVMEGEVADLGQHKDVLDGKLTPNHNTVLHVAAQFGQLDYVKEVLETCPSLLRRRNIKGETPLHMAARDGQAEIVEALILRAKELETRELESGLGGTVKEMLRATNVDGDTALHMAARNCHLELEVKYLEVVESLEKRLLYWGWHDLTVEEIMRRLEVDREEAQEILRAIKEVEEIMRATKVDRDTALHMAARNRMEKANRDSYLEVVKLLSEEDAEFQHPPNNFQETPLYLAAERGIMGVAIVDTLVETYKSLLTYSGPGGRTVLHAAALHDSTDILKVTMKPSLYTSAMRGDDADLEQHKDVLDGELTPNHNTVLHVAAQFGRLDYVKKVLEECPSLLRRLNIKKETPLHMAAREGHAEIVKAMIARAKRLEEELESGLVGAVKEMLRATNLDGDTALHMAARNCHLEGEKYLKVLESLKNGLIEYWDLLDSDDMTVWAHIRLDLKVNREEAEQIRRATNVIKEVKEIMRAKKVDRDTALHMAARNRLEKENKENRDSYLEVVKLLSQEDAEFQHPPNKFQETPLYLAAERGIMSVAIVNTLVETYKSLLTYSGPGGRTALHAAALKDFTGKSTKKLLKWKKNLINQADEYGWIPLRYATCNGNTEGVKELLAMDGSRAYITTTNKGDQDTSTSNGNENGVIELLVMDESGAYITITNKDDPDKALHIAAAYGHEHVIEELLHIAPDCWEMVNSKGQNALHIAVDMNMDSVISFILHQSWAGQLINQRTTKVTHLSIYLLLPIATLVSYGGIIEQIIMLSMAKT